VECRSQGGCWHVALEHISTHVGEVMVASMQNLFFVCANGIIVAQDTVSTLPAQKGHQLNHDFPV
jgi:hypothetical protein